MYIRYRLFLLSFFVSLVIPIKSRDQGMHVTSWSPALWVMSHAGHNINKIARACCAGGGSAKVNWLVYALLHVHLHKVKVHR